MYSRLGLLCYPAWACRWFSWASETSYELLSLEVPMTTNQKPIFVPEQRGEGCWSPMGFSEYIPYPRADRDLYQEVTLDHAGQ